MPDRRGVVAMVAENVRVECGRKGWKQSDAARALNWSRSAVNVRWMGARAWQLEDLQHLAGVLRIPVSKLLNVARLEGFEPPTFYSVVQRWLWLKMTGRFLAPVPAVTMAHVTDIHSREWVA